MVLTRRSRKARAPREHNHMEKGNEGHQTKIGREALQIIIAIKNEQGRIAESEDEMRITEVTKRRR